MICRIAKHEYNVEAQSAEVCLSNIQINDSPAFSFVRVFGLQKRIPIYTLMYWIPCISFYNNKGKGELPALKWIVCLSLYPVLQNFQYIRTVNFFY